MWTYNRLDLQTLESQPIMPKNLPITAPGHNKAFDSPPHMSRIKFIKNALVGHVRRLFQVLQSPFWVVGCVSIFKCWTLFFISKMEYEQEVA